MPRPARKKPAADDRAAASRNTIAAKLARAGLSRDWDFVLHLPLRYEDETRVTAIAALVPGTEAQVEAEVLSADAFAAFEESGNPVDPVTGARFLKEILSVGGSRPAIESFRAFRGRDPQVDALLRHSGMTTETA